MSEILRTPRELLLHGICKIPAGKAGKAAAKQYANERKARIKALARLATADSKAGVGLLIMLNSADRGLGRYIFKKLDKVIPFYVRALSDGKSGMSAEEMRWLMDACEKRGYRTLWLDLAGTEKIDKRAVLHLVAGELMRVLEKPAPERGSAEVEVDVEIEPEDPTEKIDVEIIQEEPSEKAQTVQEEHSFQAEKEAENIAEAEAAFAESKAEECAEYVSEAAESPVVENKPAEEEIPITEEVPALEEKPEAEEKLEIEEMPAVEENPVTEEMPAVKENPVTEEMPAVEENPVTEEKPAPRRRSRKTSAKNEGEKAPAKPRRKRAPAAPLTVEATLAKRRRQMGLE